MFRFSRWFFGVLLVAATVGACAEQGQGERCDPLSGNTDCAEGLVCVKAEQLALVEVGAVCCPPPGADDNPVEECRGEIQTDGGNTILPVDDSDAAIDAAVDAQ